MINLLYKALKMHKLVISVIAVLMSGITLAAIKADTAAFVDTSSYTSEFTAIPPFLETATGKPSVVLAFDVSGSMLVPAYPESGTSWSGGIMDNFDPDASYFGYFEDDKKYAYSIENEFFVEFAGGDWDGGFLNWLTMRRVDVARKVMIGGKVVDRDGVSVGSDTYYVLEAEREVRASDDYRKSYALSSTVSPIPDGTTLTIADAQIQGAVLAEADTDTTTVITDKLEMGSFHQAWDLDEYTDQSVWPTVNFRNTYVDPVFVVATLSYHGQDNSTVHGHNVTTTSAQVGLAEWANANGHGAADTIYYMVAEQGCHTIEMDDGSEMNFCAGNDTSIDNRDEEKTIMYASAFGGSGGTSPFGSSVPAVFAGAIMDADNRVDSTTRVYDISSSTFDIRNTHQETSSTDLNESAGNAFHWIAIDKDEGVTSSGSTIKVFDVGSVGSGGVDYSYSSPEFDEVPFVMATAQTDAGYAAPGGSPYSVRVGSGGEEFGGSGLDEDSLRVALQPNSGSTVTAQSVSAIAVKGVAQTIRIRVAVLDEPTGLVQENDSTINFGLTVYNFDHRTDNLSNIVTGNQVHGGTMHPCYPIFDDPDRWGKRVADAATNPDAYVHETTLYNGSTREYVCVPTSVHSPNDSIVQVIEDYPMIWGTTPIAESIVDVARYVRQDNTVHYTSVGGSSSSQRRFGNDPAPVVGVDGTASAGSYLWDPYYDEVQEQKLQCKKVFALNFNDGAPYKDYDGSASDHPQSSTYLYDIDNDSHTENEALDNVVLALRQNDCRSEADLTGHQEVISYFVYAALGADEQSNTSTRRMREAAARGGFVDENSDNLPDPMHPTNASGTIIDFNAYAALNSTPGESNPTDCPTTEWDSNNDCEPDTFFLALDGAEIKDKLQAALTDILARVASGGAAAVVSATSSGEGAIFQSSFVPTKSVNNDVVRWYGNLQALMIDADGYLRSDGNQNSALDDPDSDGNYSEDPIVDTCYDKTNKVARLSLATTVGGRPTVDDLEDCDPGKFPYDPVTGGDLKPLWEAGGWLSDLTDAQVSAQRGTYSSSSPNRFIKTALPNASGELVMTDFTPNSFSSTDWVGMLDTANSAEAEVLINYIRGLEVDDGSLRNRTFNKGTSDEVVNRMGDIIYSSPLAVARPSERLNLVYDDTSYNDFFKQYRNRRTMLYVGGNDGMLHAYNGGWYDRASKTFTGSVTGAADWELGQEVWAYVPFNLLPHLKYTTNPDYGKKDGDHSYFVDQTPYVFDARIFGDDGQTGQPNVGSGADEVETHPNGWGTIMVVGFRTGGGTAEVYPDPADLTNTQTVRPAYLVFDITNPELEPVLLAEFSHEKLGMSLSTPTGVTVGQVGITDPSTDWFMMLGSGPSSTPSGNEQVASAQNAHLFLLNLKTMELQSGFGVNGVWDLGVASSTSSLSARDVENSFVGDLVAADWDLDETTNAVYFGTSQGKDTHDVNGDPWPDLDLDGIPDSSDGFFEDWAGKLFRVRVEPSSLATSHRWAIDVMYDAGLPINARPGLSFDTNLNRWVNVGTGRYFNAADSVDDTNGMLFGVKEPRDSSDRSQFLADTAAITDDIDTISTLLVDVTDAEVTESTGALNGTVSSPVALPSDTYESLREMQMGYEEPTEYLNGWVKGVDLGDFRGTRAMGSPVILGGVMTQTLYAPDQLACSVTGNSQLYALDRATGTARQVHTFSAGDTVATNDVVDESAFIGVTPSMSPGVHLGDSRADNESTMINQNSDLSLTSTIQENIEGINSKEASWREL